MTLPFLRSEFFSVFGRYNDGVWPAQVALYLLGIIALVLALRGTQAASRASLAVLAILWLWMGVVYHAGFFVAINPAAVVFAALFIAQALLFIRLAARPQPVVFAPRRDLAGWAGGGLVLLGLVIYPMLSAAAGHHYPLQPTFGLPCPTTIFTLGMLLWLMDTAPRYVLIIPALWSIIGTAGAFLLGVPEDLSLGFSLAVVAAVWTTRTMDARRTRGKPTRNFRDYLIEMER